MTALFPVSAPAAYAAGAGALLLLLLVVLVAVRRRRHTAAPVTEEQQRQTRIDRARSRANGVTYVIASIATAASLVGMWPVTRAAVIAAGIPEALTTPVALTVLGLLEGTIVVCGIRARANVLESGDTGVDGLGLWVAVGASSLISATEAAVAAPAGTPAGETFVTVLVRLAAPVVAGWLWERGLAPERRAARGETRLGIVATYIKRLRTNLLSWAGDADADEISRRRAAARASRLSEKLRGADENALTRRQRWTLRRLRKALRTSRAAHNAGDRRYLLADIAASRHALDLAHVATPSPWEPAEATRAERHVVDTARTMPSATDAIRRRLAESYPGEPLPALPSGGVLFADVQPLTEEVEHARSVDEHFADAAQVITGTTERAATPSDQSGEPDPADDAEEPPRGLAAVLAERGQTVAAAQAARPAQRVTVKVPEQADTTGEAPAEQADYTGRDQQTANTQASTERAESDDTARTTGAADPLAEANRSRAEAARQARAELADAWRQAHTAEPELTKEDFAARHGTTANRLRTALRETTPEVPEGQMTVDDLADQH
ncbi:hypothetical protein ACFYPC_09505 [Streptomyces sp. NPDC005808]|uniref:hypothetical protein n=1 Tax=Streptomyces sp. NPDC005808 TaxID=3364734 RepID=UPI00367AEC31